MYKEYFHLSHYPFHNTPNPDFYYNGPSHREALATMVYGVQEGKGFVLVTGDVGTGKTMLVQALKRELGDRYIQVEISHPWISPEDVLSILCTETGLTAVERENPAVMDLLRRRLTELDAQGRRVVLVIDEAHQLPERTLEGIRLLSNIETPQRKLIQIVLLGQEELSALLGQYSMRQLQQRIALSYHLLPLNEAETTEYVHHRMRVAGGNPALFSPEGLELVYCASLGSPRIINQICDNALLIAFGRGAAMVDAGMVDEAIERLRPVRPPAEERWAPAQMPRAPDPAEMPMPPLPFDPPMSTLPAIGLPEAAPEERDDRRNGRLLIVGLIAGLLVGAAALWLSQEYLTDPRRSRPAADAARTPPVPAATPAPAAPEPLSAAMPEQVLPFPYSSERLTNAPLVTVSEKDGVTLLASAHFGAWNETVQDILRAANPEIADLDKVPPGTSVRMPRVSRQAMVVQDARGVSYVYYASFLTEEAAAASLQLLRQTWNNAFLTAASGHGQTVHRIYVGGFDRRAGAEAAAAALWFKYLPTIN